MTTYGARITSSAMKLRWPRLPSETITSVDSRDAREMIASDGIELYLDIKSESGREVSLALSKSALEDLKTQIEEHDKNE